ncbi:hemolysin D [Methylibium sp. Pch-M]|uniref:PAQR family membrane homeostasis protein TrhA n=1 Tax=Methylibium sp. Pch-M TaxID=2082386 RepID=UPI0010128933|nr:hemolysin III family protein [Methylibium sp. Pch-M]QAZ40052.1 hemolysin D [Methylibium sp. Pch-M]
MVLPERPQTAAEELANAVSHGLGLLLALASLPVVVEFAARHGSLVKLVGVSVFSATMILVYFASALYHALPPGRAKRWCNTLDHVAIYLFIAGSYTPVALGRLPDGPGWTLLGLVWALAVIGALLKITRRLANPLLSTALYVAMGWLAVLAAGPVLRDMPPGVLAWLLAGGLAYLVGVVFFVLDSRLRFGHFVWHLFVLAGSTCHVLAVLGPAV